MAKQTNFVKLSKMQIEILNFWLGKPILVYEIKSQTWTKANRRRIHLCAILCAKTQNLNAKYQKLIVDLKEALEN